MTRLSESAIIARIRMRLGRERSHRPSGAWLDSLGLSDDAAMFLPGERRSVVVSTDTLNVGVHFFADVVPADLGWKALAVNLSDLAAMGAEPLGYTLALSAPELSVDWLDGLLDGLSEMQDASGIVLLGGDTTRGSLSLTVTVLGEVEAGQALRRNGANVGDWICVSGQLGSAAGALQRLLGERAASAAVDAERLLERALLRPQPRLQLGRFLRSKASAAMDLSDGLYQDLARLAAASNVGASLWCDALPVLPELVSVVGPDAARELALSGGDDYELLFTVPERLGHDLASWQKQVELPLTLIGRIEAEPRIRLLDRSGASVSLKRAGFDHFPDGSAP